jgi:hypothetical protein
MFASEALFVSEHKQIGLRVGTDVLGMDWRSSKSSARTCQVAGRHMTDCNTGSLLQSQSGQASKYS